MTTSTQFTPPKVGEPIRLTKPFLLNDPLYDGYFPEGILPSHDTLFCSYHRETGFHTEASVHVLVIGRYWHVDCHWLTVQNPVFAIPAEYFLNQFQTPSSQVDSPENPR